MRFRLWHSEFPILTVSLGFIHTLFAVEDLHGVRVEKNENEVHIVFDGNKPNVDRSVFQMLAAWAEQAEKYRSGEISKEQYDEWRSPLIPKYDTTQRLGESAVTGAHQCFGRTI